MILALFILPSLVSALVSLQDLKSSLQNFSSNPNAKYDSSSLACLKIATNTTDDNKKTAIMLSSGLYAGYQTNIDFLFNFTSSILQNLSNKDTKVLAIMDAVVFYIVPVLNEKAYNNYYNYSLKAPGNGMIFKTDGSLISGCNNSVDSGINLDHNFPYQWSNAGEYGNNCSSEYAGNNSVSSPAVKVIQDFIFSHGITFIMNYNYDQNAYIQPYTYDSTMELDPYHTQFFSQVSDFVKGKSFKYGRNKEIMGNNTTGSFIDSSLSIIASGMTGGIKDSNTSHADIIYSIAGLFIPTIEVTYTGSIFYPNETRLDVTYSDIVVINFTISLQSARMISEVLVEFTSELTDDETFELLGISLNISGHSANATEDVSNVTVSSDDSKFTAGFTYPFMAFSTFYLSYSLGRINNAGGSIDISLNLTSNAVTIQKPISKFTVDGTGSDGEDSGDESSGSDDSDRNAILAASFVLIGINIAIIITAIIWKICRRPYESRDFKQPGVPTFNPKSENKI